MSLDADGYYYISLTNVNASSLGVVVNNGASSGTLQTVDLSTSTDICWDLSSTPNSSGKYTATENTTCGAQTSTVESKRDAGLNIYPTIITDAMTLSADKQIVSVTVNNLLGGEVINTTSTSIPTSSLAKGIYLVKVMFADSSTEVRRIVKK